jgi:N-carbamoylputrescine amidase
LKAALIVNRIKDSIDENLEDILRYVKTAGEYGCDLVVLPEAALTGLWLTDDPKRDIDLGLSMDDPRISELCALALEHNINIAFGMLEKFENKLYDTALFINRQGKIALKYQRISKGWRDANQETIYKEGQTIGTYDSDIGKVCFLICGDLFDDGLSERVKELNAEFLIFPFARSFIEGVIIKEMWENEAFYEYIERIKRTGTITLGTNYIDDYCFGGAFVVDENGSVMANMEVLREGILVAEM